MARLLSGLAKTMGASLVELTPICAFSGARRFCELALGGGAQEKMIQRRIGRHCCLPKHFLPAHKIRRVDEDLE